MTETQFNVTWESYPNHVSKGISSLQQNGEFVDMTLAAEGHLVKVHQNVVALASPYLKAMLLTVPCQHPVIFLNNISHEVLGYILEYIYTGEVKVPSNRISKFIKACRSLCINGIKDNIEEPKVPPVSTVQIKQQEFQESRVDNEVENFAAHITINPQENDYNLQLIPNQNNISNSRNNEQLVSTQAVSNMGYNAPDINVPTKIENIETVEDAAICDNSIDINSINNFMIINPAQSSSHNLNLSTTEEIKPLQELIDINLNTEHIQTQPIENAFMELPSGLSENLPTDSNVELQTNAIQNPIQITLDPGIWQKSNQNDPELELQTNTIENGSSLLMKPNWQILPSQDNTNVELSSNLPVNVPLNASNWQTAASNKPKITIISDKILSKMKSKHNSCVKLGTSEEINSTKITLNKVDRIRMDKIPHYSISNRGSIQLLLNRFLYHSHHHSHQGRKRRWRCIDYRKTRCKAYIDTDNEEITAMFEEHDHPNHENSIRLKIKKKIVFTSLTTTLETIEKAEDNEKKPTKKRNKIDTN
ncbi:uncharacterized protein LOC142975437 [Anticarsia gemmatalis]|uniref:uncharacterized protein LOC142975437 n=1 Tax=Anticarsia gemmatalis TaxID=129554 RepID=UPI003F7600AD